MRKYSIIATFVFCCSTLFTTNFSFATSIKDDLNTENIKAPPRDVQDILRLVDQTKPDQSIVDRAKKVVATPLPLSQDNEVLNHFYARRSAAFEDLGNTGEALKSIEIAVNLHTSTNPRLHLSDLIKLAVLESTIGQQSKAITLIKKAQAYQLSALPKSSGVQMSMGRQLLTYYVNSGNFEQAQKTLEMMENTLSDLKRSRGYMEYGPSWEASFESARGVYFSGQGQWLESERSLRKTLHLLEAQYQKVQNSSSKIDIVGDDARSVPDSSNNPRGYINQISNRELNLANVLLRQRKLIDAEFYARKSITLSLSSFGSNSIQVARGLRSLANIINEQGRYAEAVLLSKAALATVRAAGATGANNTLAAAQKSLGSALVADGKYVEANQVFEEMAAGIKTDPDMAKSYQFGDLDWVLAMLKTGKFNQAFDMSSAMLKRLELSADKNSPRAAMVRAFEAASLQAGGKWSEADVAYKASIPILIDQARNDAENDTSSIKQQQRMTFLLESYLASLAHTVKTDTNQALSATAQAFQVADIARSSGVQRALTASAARASINDPQLASLARQEQDLQKRINTLSDLLTGLRSATPDQQLPGVQGKIRSDIEIFKSQRDLLKKNIEKKFPENTEGLLKLAELYFFVQKYQKGIDYVNKALRIDENLAKAYFLKGSIYRESGDTSKAISSLETAIEQDNKFEDAFYDLGVIYASRKNPIAFDYYNNVIKLNPTNQTVKYARAKLLQDLGKIDEAISEYKNCLKSDTNCQNCYYNLGAIYLQFKKDNQKAIEFLSKAIEVNPSYLEAYFARGYAYSLLKQKESAKADYNMCLKIQPNYELAIQALNNI